MANLTKANLQYDYKWSHVGDDDPKKTGNPDHVELNRQEGYEVLPFLNKNYPTNSDALKAERAVHKVPGNLRTRKHIYDWIKANWSTLA